MNQSEKTNDVKRYSLAADGRKVLSKNFRVSEFRCHDGSDAILISDNLVKLLQKIRDHFSAPLIINSGYRTPSHDKRSGGSGAGYHTKGMAADIRISGVEPITIAAYAQSMLGKSGGVECGAYPSGGYVHVDVRPGKWRAVKASGAINYLTVSSLYPTVRNGSRGQTVIILQRALNSAGFDCGAADGICGKNTVAAIRAYQSAHNLDIDGICGKNTWNSICKQA